MVYLDVYAADFPKSTFKYFFSSPNYFFFKYIDQKVLQSTFSKLHRFHIKIYPQTTIEPKYGAHNSDNKISVHTERLSFWIGNVIRRKSTLSKILCIQIKIYPLLHHNMVHFTPITKSGFTF